MKKYSVIVACMLLGTCISQAQQLGIYEFNVGATCDAIDMAVTAQPADATFSLLTMTNNPNCEDNALEYLSTSWKQGGEDLALYHLTFTISANPTYAVYASNINFDVRRADQGPKKGNVYASVDGGPDVQQGATAFTIGTTMANVSIPLNLLTLSSGNIVFKISFFQATNSGIPAKMWIDNIQLNGSIALPIELIDFSARLTHNKDVQLQWTTASETNNDFFTIQRSKDGLNFEEVAIVDAAGNSSTLTDYTAVDRYPYSGISYYRLKQTDFNGEYSNSELVAINNDALNGTISLYPNPTSGEIIISNTAAQTGNAVIKDVLGRTVLQESIDSYPATIDFSSHSPGVYFVTIEAGDDSFSQKVILTR